MKLYPTFRGWWIVGVSFFGLYLHGSTTSYLFALLIVPMEQDLGWSRTLLIGALTTATFVAAVFGMLVGPLWDRHGVRLGMTLSALSGGSVIVLLAFIDSPWQWYLLVGLGLGTTRVGLENVGPRTVIANWFVRRRAAAFAWFSGGRAVFGATAVPVIALLVANSSWRAGWLTVGLMELLLLTPLAWIIVRRRPEDQGELPDGEPTGSPFNAEPDANADAFDNEVHWTRAETVRSRTFWLLVIAFVLQGFPATGIIANMVPYYQDNGLSLVAASWAFSMYGWGALFGRPFWGYVASRYGVHVALTAFGLSYGVTITAFVLASNAPMLFIASFPLGTVIGGVQQLQAQAWPDYFGRRHVGAIAGLTTLLIVPAMAMGPLIAALSFDLLGTYRVVFTAFAIAAYIAGAFFWLAKPPRLESHGLPSRLA